jgi:hypothetical protein
MEYMFYSPTILLTPHNYLEWKPKKILHLRCRGLYQIAMAMEVEPDSIDEKNDFLDRQDMAIGFIYLSISLEILHEVCDVSQEFTPNELWTRLEVLFGNKEECMQNVDKIDNVENPLEDKSSQFEEPSTKVSTQICIPLIEDDIYSISDLFFEIHVEDIWHASQESHEDTFPCAMHASQETKRESRTSNSIMIFSQNNLQKQIGYLNSYRENIQFKKKKNRLKQSRGSEVMIVLKSTKFQHFSRNSHTVFKIASKLYLDLIHYKKRKWICVEISMVHLLHQIFADIYIFNKIFNENKLARLRGLLGVKDKVA